jgi:glycosyltransferase involved in cell wall biosynthesis
LSIAVLLPCFNEAASIAAVVGSFRQQLPSAVIYVYDNNSTDATATEARAAGAVVQTEYLAGKGSVVCRMFADIDADVYLLADGDGTYDSADAPAMVHRLLSEKLDMIVGVRVAQGALAYRRGHVLGNTLFNVLVSRMFGQQFTDIFSGYRVFSRRFVKSFPALSAGFEIEAQMSVHALEMRMKTAEVKSAYAARPEGSVSKLRTYRDGALILNSLLILLKETKPIAFYGVIAGLLAVGGTIIGSGSVIDFVQTGRVPRLPRAVLASAVMILSALSLIAGIVLDSLSRSRREIKRLMYLQQPWIASRPPPGIPPTPAHGGD